MSGGGAGGGTNGENGLNTTPNSWVNGLGGSQTSGGVRSDGSSLGKGVFGLGGSHNTDGWNCGGGGGFYGGGAGRYGGAGGGAGYLNTSKLITGTTSMQNGKCSGNGQARITPVN